MHLQLNQWAAMKDMYRGTTWTGSASRMVCVCSPFLKWIKLEHRLVVFVSLLLSHRAFQVIPSLQSRAVLHWVSFYNTESLLQLFPLSPFYITSISPVCFPVVLLADLASLSDSCSSDLFHVLWSQSATETARSVTSEMCCSYVHLSPPPQILSI